MDVIKIKKIINEKISIKQIDEIKLNIYSWIDSSYSFEFIYLFNSWVLMIYC